MALIEEDAGRRMLQAASVGTEAAAGDKASFDLKVQLADEEALVDEFSPAASFKNEGVLAGLLLASVFSFALMW